MEASMPFGRFQDDTLWFWLGLSLCLSDLPDNPNWCVMDIKQLTNWPRYNGTDPWKQLPIQGQCDLVNIVAYQF